MRHIIESSSTPGDVVLDTFVGSGSTAIACRELGRGFVGCEMGDVEFDRAIYRLG
jgi:DNA modification methylase